MTPGLALAPYRRLAGAIESLRRHEALIGDETFRGAVHQIDDSALDISMQLELARALLRALQWCSEPGAGRYPVCHFCNASQQFGHEPECDLAAFLGND